MHALRIRGLLVLLGFSALASARAQSTPSWWGNAFSSPASSVAQNYAPLLSGQARHLADQARIHLNTQLAALGGAGQQINEMCAAWPGNAPDAYAPVSVGQLKALADAFFARLDAVGFTGYKAQLIANGYVGAWSVNPSRPWDENLSPAQNYVPANLGQAKLLFCWDVTGYTNPLASGGDQDGDGLANGVESANGSDPADYYSQGGALIKPRVFIFSGGNQFTPANQFSARPIVFRVVNAATGAPLPNAPVVLSVSSGTGKLALSSGGTAQASFATVTDAQGFARAYFKAE